ncbi:hypothetical protein BD779DRAFT_1530551 [Infundibulicybe gibba]|nr:hypothetical protein BD779DRAFT_1530551 [Infundibulicybe gibba]
MSTNCPAVRYFAANGISLWGSQRDRMISRLHRRVILSLRLPTRIRSLRSHHLRTNRLSWCQTRYKAISATCPCGFLLSHGIAIDSYLGGSALAESIHAASCDAPLRHISNTRSPTTDCETFAPSLSLVLPGSGDLVLLGHSSDPPPDCIY